MLAFLRHNWGWILLAVLLCIAVVNQVKMHRISKEKQADDHPLDRSGSANTVVAVITGASSGLGREYFRRIAKRKDIAELWVIARRRDRLEELAAETDKTVRVFAVDLTDREQLGLLGNSLNREKPVVKFLVNAAGMGKIGSYRDISADDSAAMVDLDCSAPVQLTQMVLPYMVRGSHILNVCSTAAFQPFQYMSVYAAGKAFLYRYSRALRVELLGRGISVTAVCPYWMKDTEFIAGAKKTKNSSYVWNYPLSSSKKVVSFWSYRDTCFGFAVSTPGIICTAHRIVAKFVPSELMMWVWALIRRL